jgi:aspartyl-tRNA(Asn)/glutamyl-tRNA(Gln) amidotransferase subunit B
MTEMPRLMAQRFVDDYGIKEKIAAQLTSTKALAAYFEEALTGENFSLNPHNVSVWVLGELTGKLNDSNLSIDKSPVNPKQLGKLILRVSDKTISATSAKQILDVLWRKEGDIDAIIDELGLKQMSDTGELESIIDTVLASNAKSVEEYKAGNAKAFNALVGQAMKATKGKGNPAQVNELLKKKLG